MGQRGGRRGSLEVFTAGYRAYLEELGFAPVSVRNRLSQWRSFGCWLEAEGLTPRELTDGAAQQYLAARRAAGHVAWVSGHCLTLPTAYLRSVGVALEEPLSAGDGTTENVLAAFRTYLVEERGLAAATQRAYLRIARSFCESRSATAGGLGQTTAEEVTAFVVATCATGRVALAKKTISALASLLRYLHVTGVMDEPLCSALPRVAAKARSPRGVELDAGAVTRLLAGCSRCRQAGARDRAVIMLLARLGLRAGEVAALGLDDLDWRRGEVLIHGKGDRVERLPLPPDVGQAVAGYLRGGRPSAPPGCRAVFLRMSAPAGPLTSGAVSLVVNRAARRAGLPGFGAHRLRHFAATTTLRGGAPLPDVAELMRQRSRR